MKKQLRISILAIVFVLMMFTQSDKMMVDAIDRSYEESVSSIFDSSTPVMKYAPSLPDQAGADPPLLKQALPSEFNWRDHEGGDWTTTAKHQGACGSCWAFGALGALEAIINIEHGDPTFDLDLSEQYVLSCLPSAGSCDGGLTNEAFMYMMSETMLGNGVNGIIPESCFPYYADDSAPCYLKCPDWEDYLIPISHYGYQWPYMVAETEDGRNAIKSWLIEKGPIATYMYATDHFGSWGVTHHSSDDYYPYPGPIGDETNHVVVIVGYKDDQSIGNGGYWIVKNSWGPIWGNEGFYNVEYESLNHGNFITYAYTMADGTLADYGDAPDDTSDPGNVFAYPGVAGRFPSLCDSAHVRVPNRQGVNHLSTHFEWLGATSPSSTTKETDAKIIDLDEDDPGTFVTFTAPGPPYEAYLVLPIFVASDAPGAPSVFRYLNVLIDENRDGEWRDEWVIRNLRMSLTVGTWEGVVAGPFSLLSVGVDQWMRVTLTRDETIDPGEFESVGGWDGSAPAGGFQFGETEDMLMRPVEWPPPVFPPWQKPTPLFKIRPSPAKFRVPPGGLNFRIDIKITSTNPAGVEDARVDYDWWFKKKGSPLFIDGQPMGIARHPLAGPWNTYPTNVWVSVHMRPPGNCFADFIPNDDSHWKGLIKVKLRDPPEPIINYTYYDIIEFYEEEELSVGGVVDLYQWSSPIPWVIPSIVAATVTVTTIHLMKRRKRKTNQKA